MKTYLLINGKVRTVKEGADPKQVIADLIAKGYKCQKIGKPPSLKTLEKWMVDGVAKATDGCRVEPDGQCVHGHKSWLLQLNLI